MTVTCTTCHRALHNGESAWESRWKVIDATDGTVRTEVRFTCDECEVAA